MTFDKKKILLNVEYRVVILHKLLKSYYKQTNYRVCLCSWANGVSFLSPSANTLINTQTELVALSITSTFRPIRFGCVLKISGFSEISQKVILVLIKNLPWPCHSCFRQGNSKSWHTENYKRGNLDFIIFMAGRLALRENLPFHSRGIGSTFDS